MKAQASVETLVTVGLVIAFMVPVLLLLLVASQYGTENSSVYQAQASSHMIADTINDVFIQGPGASKKILINLPGNTNYLIVENSEAIISIQTSSGNYDAVSPIFGKVSNLENKLEVKGLLPLTITNTGGTVEVTANE